MFIKTTRFIFSSWKIKSSEQNIFSGCWNSKFEILVKIFGYDPMYESASTSNNSTNVEGGWSHTWKLDQKQKGIDWKKVLRTLVVTGTILLIPVLVVLIGTTLPLTPTTTMVFAVPVTILSLFLVAKAREDDPIKNGGQPIISSFGKYNSGFSSAFSS